jgi:DNA-binding MurR/RpiR family transcriptional regulator
LIQSEGLSDTQETEGIGDGTAERWQPGSFNELVQLLHSVLDDLSPGQRAIARFLLTNPDRSAFMTITELAGEAGVNESTVTRFATRIGLKGYPALSDLLQENLVSQSHFLNRFQAFEQLQQRGDDLVERSLMFDQMNLTRTFANLDRIQWDKAVSALTTGRQVYVMGLRKCYSVAHFLAYALHLIREGVSQVSLDSGNLPEQVRGLGPGDTCVGISIRRYTREVVQVLSFAQQRGATTIALTDDPASPLNRYADFTFHVEADGASILRSLTAFMSVSQALVGDVARQLGTSTRSSLLVEEDLLREFETYFQNP